MNTKPSVFKRHRETMKDRFKRLFFSLLWYGPLLAGAVWGTVYVKKILPAYVSNYFGLPAAQAMSAAYLKRAEFLKDHLSFPMGLPQYLAAQMSAIAATTKAGTLEIATNAAVSLISGLLSVLVVILAVLIVFRFLKHYKTRAAEDRLARQVANRLIPMLEEINNNVLALRAEIQNRQSPIREFVPLSVNAEKENDNREPGGSDFKNITLGVPNANTFNTEK